MMNTTPPGWGNHTPTGWKFTPTGTFLDPDTRPTEYDAPVYRLKELIESLCLVYGPDTKKQTWTTLGECLQNEEGSTCFFLERAITFWFKGTGKERVIVVSS